MPDSLSPPWKTPLKITCFGRYLHFLLGLAEKANQFSGRESILSFREPLPTDKYWSWNPTWRLKILKLRTKKVKHLNQQGEFFGLAMFHVPIMYRKKSSISWMPRLEELELGYDGSAEPKIHYLPSDSVLRYNSKINWMTTRWAGTTLGSNTIASNTLDNYW